MMRGVAAGSITRHAFALLAAFAAIAAITAVAAFTPQPCLGAMPPAADGIDGETASPRPVEAPPPAEAAFPASSSRPNRLPAILLAGGGVALLAGLAGDPHASPAGGGTLRDLAPAGSVYGDGNVMAFGAASVLAAGLAVGDRRLVDLGGDLARAALGAGLASWGLKSTVDRRRPSGGRYSFPSGHTAMAFSAAPVLSAHLGSQAVLPAYGLALLTGAARLAEGRHYLSDVIAGATVGLAAGELVCHRRWPPGARPQVDLGPGRLVVRMRF